MEYIFEKFTEWLRELLTGGVISNIRGMFTSINEQVGDISSQVGATPAGWNTAVYRMIRELSDTVVLPLAGTVLAVVMTLELISMLTQKNGMHDVGFPEFFRWMFKTACAVLIVTNTWNIVMGIFDAAQSLVTASSNLIRSDAALTLENSLPAFEQKLRQMEVWELLGIWLQSAVAQLAMSVITVCIFIITYGRMIEIYLYTSVAPLPMAMVMNREHTAGSGENYLRSLMALGLQGLLMIVCVAIYTALVRNIVVTADISGALWTCMGYTVLLCFSLFKTSAVSRSLLSAH